MAGERRPRVLLADDYPGLLVAWRHLLEPICDVVGDAADGRTLLEEAARLEPDVVVLDLSLPDMTGLDACRALKQTMPRTKIVLITAAAHPSLAEAGFRAGASAFVRKELAGDDLPMAIETILMGETYCSAFPSAKEAR